MEITSATFFTPLSDWVSVVYEDGTGICVPVNEENSDYRALQAWVAEGNEIQPFLPATVADSATDLAEGKALAAQQVRELAHEFLLPTDWVTARKVDTGEDAPANIEAFRSAVRTAAAEKAAAVDSKGSLEDLLDYLRSDAFTQWPQLA